MNILPPLRRSVRYLAACVLSSLVLLGPPVLAASTAPPQSFQGTLHVQIEDYAKQTSVTRYHLLQNGRRLELRNVRDRQGLVSGTNVRVRGKLVGNVLMADTGAVYPSGDGNLLAYSSAAPELLYASGVQNVAVILVNFSDDPVQPATAAAIQNTVFGTTSDFLRENSSDQTWLAGGVFGWYTLPLSKASCETDKIATLADQAATAAGVNLSAYSRKFYVFPKNTNCLWGGAADFGGANTRAWFNGKFDLHTFAHEFGHNLGLSHAHGLDCDLSPLGDSCTALTTGDSSDLLGAATEGHYIAFHKERLGWLPSLVTVAANGRYQLAPYELGTGARALRIPRSVDASGRQTWYYLEYRQPVGFDHLLAYYGTLSQGVLVKTATTGDVDSPYLLDMTPNSDPSNGTMDLWDGALMAGRSYTDVAANVSISVVSTDAAGAVIDISLGGGAVCTRVTPSIALSVAPAATAGTPVSVTVTATNRDSSACAATNFSLAGVVPAGWSGSFSAASLSLSPGATGTSNFSLTSAATATAGTYSFSTNASCSRGSACTGSATGSETVITATSSLSETVASSKLVYSRGEVVGLGAQLLNNGLPVSGSGVVFTITRPNGSPVVVNATTGSSGTASATYKLNKQRDLPGVYGLRAQSTWGGQTASATTSFQVQ